MKFGHITIIGVGLIGGSIGLAVKRQRLARRVTGVTAHMGSLRRAIRKKAIDDGTLDVRKSVAGSDLVIVATPADMVLPTIKKIRRRLKPGCVVTDVASTKADIVSGAEAALGRNVMFVGGHPMAGSEKRGVDKARAGLYRDSICLLTETANTDRAALQALVRFWRRLGAGVTVISPACHDRLICGVSHLPHIAAAALCLSACTAALPFASTGFDDTTRVAAGDPRIWTPIVFSNRKNILPALEEYMKVLREVRTAIRKADRRRITAFLRSAKSRRDKL